MILQANALYIPLRDASVQCCVTSPPYWGLRDYGIPPTTWPDGWVGCLGLEPTPELYVEHIVEVFQEIRRVLRKDGTVWINIGDCYARAGGTQGGGNRELLHMEGKQRRMTKLPPGGGLKPKDLVGIPWRVAFALQADGWYLRSDIIWSKNNPMPESVTDRPTKSHEYIFLLTKSARYFFDAEAVREGSITCDPRKPYGSDGGWQMDGRNKWEEGKGKARDNGSDVTRRNLRSVWTIATAPYSDAHFATFPPEIPKRCILAGTSARGCCKVCGAPWVRKVERTAMIIDRTHNHPVELRTRTSGTVLQPASAVTTGWRPTCAHDAPAVPTVVLDPFGGSMTTVAVAESLGRRGIRLDLKAEYLAMGQMRMRGVTLGLPI